jgi:hypothetical protein
VADAEDLGDASRKHDLLVKVDGKERDHLSHSKSALRRQPEANQTPQKISKEEHDATGTDWVIV